MNNLKFRAFDGGEMEYFDLEDIYHNKVNPFHGVRDVPIMQFTGHTDKNGKEIYIHDVIKFSEIDFPYEVIINDFMQIPVVDNELGQMRLHECHSIIEVVGNIYQVK